MNSFSFFQRAISLVLKIIVTISACVGIFFSAYAGRHSFMGGRTVFMYFTIQSNFLIALICLIGAVFLLKATKISEKWYVFKLVGTVSITLTGMVFCFVLAPTMGKYAWNIQNVLTHVVVPIVAVIDFFVTGIRKEWKYRSIFWVILPPILYAIYAGIGYVCNWQFSEGCNYPYFFLNWGSPAGAFGFTSQLPFMGCAWWILALLLFLLGTAWIYLLIIKGLRRIFVSDTRDTV